MSSLSEFGPNRFIEGPETTHDLLAPRRHRRDAIREKCSAQVMGLQPVEWQDPVIDEPKLRAARSGRLGFTFVVIAMRCRLGV